MQEVADKAGVHRTTVSLALRNSPKLAKATRERVQSIARKMGYHPNPMISSLMSQRRSRRKQALKSSVAFITAWDRPFEWRDNSRKYKLLFEGAARKASELGFHLEHFWAREKGLSSKRVTQILRTRNVHGLLIAPLPRFRLEQEETPETPNIDWSEFACIGFGYTPKRPAFNRVVHDYFHGMQTAVRECLAIGYKRPCLALSRAIDSSVDYLWNAAYLIEMQRSMQLGRIPAVLSYEECDPKPFHDWLRKNKPDAIISLDPRFISAQLENADPAVSKRPGLISLDLKQDQSDIAGIKQNSYAIGSVGMDQLAGMLLRNEKGLPENPQDVSLRGVWQPGNSLPSKATKS